MMVRLIKLVASCAALAFAQSAQLERFEKRIRPVLAAQCYGCHGKTATPPQGGLQLDSAQAIRRGGNSGPLFQPGNPESSILLRALRHTDKSLKMPPGKALGAEIISDFELWIRDGAALPEDKPEPTENRLSLWSLKKPMAAAPPSATTNPIDAFILQRLTAKGLQPSPEADKRTLIRRATYDLSGLPPTAEEIDAFTADNSPKAYERLIDRLLSSPRYGERYGRHWLDVARYSDSVNDSVNAGQRYPWSYTYRDWVIAALNEDLPYNRFVEYQISADRMPNTEPRHLAALGFLSLGREFPKSYPETVDDRIDAITRGFLGLTVACARCHDHKYDPISTKDYYSLYSILSNIQKPKEMPLLTRQAPDLKQSIYQPRLDKIQSDYRQYRVRRHAEMVAFFKTQEAEYFRAAKDSALLSNTEVEELARDRQLNLHVLNRFRKGIATPLDVPLDEFELIYTEGDSNNSRTLRNRGNTMLANWAYDGAAPRAMAVEDVPHPEAAHVFVRGNPNNPGALTPARFLSCLGGESKLFRNGSGRLELAQAIADSNNPLTARVAVNRAWMHHFGAGLVRTPSDFGLRGDSPTHPELLDYLAAKLIESGWSLKKLHRMMMTSATYRQASTDNEAARKVDPENLLLWRMNRRRLDIESLRDSMLAAAGRLDLTLGGLPISLTAQPSVPRRSIYGFIERGRVPAMLSAFDFAPPDQHAPMRYVTTVPQQALFFLNSPFVTEQAHHLAARTAKFAAPAERIQNLYRYALSRKPSEWELDAGLKFISRSAEAAAATDSGPSTWQYGIGDSENFRPFPIYDGDRWQGAASIPAPVYGRAQLRPTGGEPGDGPAQAVVRRWTSPISGAVTIEGIFRHAQPAVPFGDGVRGHIVSSRHGELASWTVNGSSAETKLGGIRVEKGDQLDFIVDGRTDTENDTFTWTPIVRSGTRSWNAKDDFAGPAPKPLTVWERYAQVLLETNEFAFVD